MSTDTRALLEGHDLQISDYNDLNRNFVIASLREGGYTVTPPASDDEDLWVWLDRDATKLSLYRIGFYVLVGTLLVVWALAVPA